MREHLFRLPGSAVVALTLFFGSSVFADGDGHLEGKLRQALTAVAQGKCPADLMSPLLLSTCQDQQPGMGQRLSSAGAITSTQFMGIQQTPSGPCEVYKVIHERGRATWLISSDSQGKIVVLWTGG